MAKKIKTRRVASVPSAPITRTEFNPDYSNVKKDLKRIGTLAVIFFTLIIVLSFFLR
ncbi:MAG: hypothetical protein AB1649_18775 [Chloroflexota bacterium]